MAMISIKRRPKSTLRDKMVEPVEYEEPKYPYGTKIDLDNETMELLGLDADDFSVDDRVKVVAKAKVCRTGKREYTDHEGNVKYEQDVELQITHLELLPIDSKTVRELMRMIKG